MFTVRLRAFWLASAAVQSRALANFALMACPRCPGKTAITISRAVGGQLHYSHLDTCQNWSDCWPLRTLALFNASIVLWLPSVKNHGVGVGVGVGVEVVAGAPVGLEAGIVVAPPTSVRLALELVDGPLPTRVAGPRVADSTRFCEAVGDRVDDIASLAITGEAVCPLETALTKKPPWKASRTSATASATRVEPWRNAGGEWGLAIGCLTPRDVVLVAGGTAVACAVPKPLRRRSVFIR